MILEVCVGSVADALAARDGGADRVELCSALELGGLTPSIGLVRCVTRACDLPAIAMIRSRAGGFCYDDADFGVMLDDVDRMRDVGLAGFVFGFLRQDGEIDTERCRTLMEHIGESESVFHRAFDVVPNMERSLEQLIELGVNRVLTSGGCATAPEGADRIAWLVEQAGERIEILPGCGVRPSNLRELMKRTRCQQVHGTFRKLTRDISTRHNILVSYGLPGCDDPQAIGLTDSETVTRAREILDAMD